MELLSSRLAPETWRHRLYPFAEFGGQLALILQNLGSKRFHSRDRMPPGAVLTLTNAHIWMNMLRLARATCGPIWRTLARLTSRFFGESRLVAGGELPEVDGTPAAGLFASLRMGDQTETRKLVLIR